MKKLICYLFNHKYRLLRKISPSVREIKCTRCLQEFGMNDNLKALIPLDGELRDIHNEMLFIHKIKEDMWRQHQSNLLNS